MAFEFIYLFLVGPEIPAFATITMRLAKPVAVKSHFPAAPPPRHSAIAGNVNAGYEIAIS